MVSGPKYGKEQRNQFFDLIDKGGTVRTAADATGVHLGAAYSWLRAYGLSMQHKKRAYTREERDEFFRLLMARQNVSAVA